LPRRAVAAVQRSRAELELLWQSAVRELSREVLANAPKARTKAIARLIRDAERALEQAADDEEARLRRRQDVAGRLGLTDTGTFVRARRRGQRIVRGQTPSVPRVAGAGSRPAAGP
jgi:hypothetical protein